MLGDFSVKFDGTFQIQKTPGHSAYMRLFYRDSSGGLLTLLSVLRSKGLTSGPRPAELLLIKYQKKNYETTGIYEVF